MFSWTGTYAHYILMAFLFLLYVICHYLLLKAAESVSFRNYCMWIFLFYKKLHMSKLSIKVELIPQHKPLYEFRLLAFVRNTTLSVAFYSLYNSVTEEIRTAMSI